MITIIKGNICSSDNLNKIKFYPNSFLIGNNGKIVGIFSSLPEKYKNEKIIDYKDALVMQSFSDMHLHAPQYAMLGMGMDLPLLEWLNKYTFPTEAKFNDTKLARKVYKDLAHRLVENGTTRVCMFSSLHTDSTLILMEELEKVGISGYVGKVNMDRNGALNLQETTEESIKETLRWINESKKFKNIKPIITPRFTPSCTNQLMKKLGEIAKENNLPIQSHLSENLNEIEWVKELHPNLKEYWESYKKYDLWNSKTLMAHCVHSSNREINAIKKAGVYVVHCANSNIDLTSGFAPIKDMLNQGVNVVLGSDVAGGDQISMFDNIVSTIKVSKVRNINSNHETNFLTVEEAFYLATSAANKFFDEKPGFAIGNSLNAIVVDDSKLSSAKPLSLLERFERAIYFREEKAIKAVYSNGVKIY